MDSDALDALSVSRETSRCLASLAGEIARWTRSINLISPITAEDIWTRHILDCAQAMNYAPKDATLWCDMGTGAGLPGLVAAIIDREQTPQRQFVLIESDKRKAAFLTLQVKKFDLNAAILPQRIEEAEPVSADIISARALAPLSKLLAFGLRHGRPKSTMIFLKGRDHQEEISHAQREFAFNVVAHASVSDPTAAVLVITAVSRRAQA